LSTIKAEPYDHVVSKTLNDPFFKTSLQSDLAELRPERVLVAGWATDLCVDATVRSAADKVINHHHWVWANLLAPHPVRIAREAEV